MLRCPASAGKGLIRQLKARLLRIAFRYQLKMYRAPGESGGGGGGIGTKGKSWYAIEQSSETYQGGGGMYGPPWTAGTVAERATN